MIVWVWDAGSDCGVSDDRSRARKAAAAFLRAGSTDTACVEQAFLVSGVRTLTMVYDRTGTGWSARRCRNGRIAWKPLPAPPQLAAS
jgi:hypothetical protein